MKFKFALIAVIMLANVAGEVQGALIKSYDFNSGLSDTLGAGVDLVASGGSVSGGRYHFSSNQGLRLDLALLDTSNYGIEFKVRIDDNLSGYKKLIDFQSLSSDIGLYTLGSQVNFYDGGGYHGTIALGTDFTLGLERKAGTVSIFLNGDLIDSFDDNFYTNAVSSANILNFFVDDFVTSQSESFAGSVDFIRIHQDASTFSAVPEPSSFLLVGLAVFGAVGRRRRVR